MGKLTPQAMQKVFHLRKEFCLNFSPFAQHYGRIAATYEIRIYNIENAQPKFRPKKIWKVFLLAQDAWIVVCWTSVRAVEIQTEIIVCGGELILMWLFMKYDGTILAWIYAPDMDNGHISGPRLEENKLFVWEKLENMLFGGSDKWRYVVCSLSGSGSILSGQSILNSHMLLTLNVRRTTLCWFGALHFTFSIFLRQHTPNWTCAHKCLVHFVCRSIFRFSYHHSSWWHKTRRNFRKKKQQRHWIEWKMRRNTYEK